jgi:aryl-alcohol dehydrogenase-like predicted oxidoreductase
MNQIELGNTGLRAPQIGLGCSAILGRSGRADSLLALSTAWDQGIRFFDTARSYGYGESEALLGEFLAGRRHQAVIATKFGILASRQPAWKQLAKSVARKALTMAPAARAILQKAASTQFSHNQFTPSILQASIEESLRKLKTDYVDILFLHAAPAGVLEQHDLMDAMGRLVEQGKVRVTGISAEPDVVELAVQRQVPPLQAVQFPCNVFNISSGGAFPSWNERGWLLVANQPFGGPARVRQCREILLKLVQNRSLDAALCEKLGTLNDGVFADIVLNVILRNSGIHVVIPAMMRPEHIRANVQAVANSRFDAQQIATIRQSLASNIA